MTVLYSYLIGWVVASIGLALASRRQSRPTSLAVLAGAAWPLLLLGAAQFVAVALVAEGHVFASPAQSSSTRNSRTC